MAERQLNEPTFRDRNGNTKTNIYHHYSNLTGVDGETPEELNNQDLNNQKIQLQEQELEEQQLL